MQELYDLVGDPEERINLAVLPQHQERLRAMRNRLFDRLEAAGALQVSMRRGDRQAAKRKRAKPPRY